jgi:hypothetical protein
MIRIATISAIALSLAAGAATAQNDSGKKTADGFGSLLQGMGQELNKVGGGSAKKDTKKTAAKKKEQAGASDDAKKK